VPQPDHKELYLFEAVIPRTYLLCFDDPHRALDCKIQITRLDVSIREPETFLDILGEILGLHAKLKVVRSDAGTKGDKESGCHGPIGVEVVRATSLSQVKRKIDDLDESTILSTPQRRQKFQTPLKSVSRN
jgi:hypothetical protein